MHGRVEDGALELPSLRLRPAPGFEYRGSCELEIAGIALAARHHFLDGGSSRLRVVQLEHFTAPDRTYSFELRDPVELGGELYAFDGILDRALTAFRLEPLAAPRA